MVGIKEAGMKQYGQNLWGIGSILSGAFLIILQRPNFFSVFTVLGAFLIYEHIWNWGCFELWDFIGHEWIGLVLIFISLFFSFGWISIVGFIFVLFGIYLNLYKGKDSFSKELNFLKDI